MGVVLFLPLTVDMLTSIYAAGAAGVSAESNPLMRYLLSQSVPVIAGAHVGTSLKLYLGLLLAAGLVVFANNLSVIVLNRSLL